MKSKQYLIWSGLFLIVNTAQALLYVPQTYFLNIRTNPSFSWLTAIVVTLIPFYIFALLAPPVVWLSLRFPFERGVWQKSVIVHCAASIVFSMLHLMLLPVVNSLLIHGVLLENYKLPVPEFNLLLGFGAGNIVQYWVINIICQAVIYFRRLREREESLAQAQLQALKTQLHPHFLFNTLNALSELVYEDAAQAERMISKLSELLRFSLKTEQAQEVSLSHELEFLRLYLEIQQTLLQERLQVRWRIAPETLDARVPSMLLQPLVENSIRHGVAPRRVGGTIKIVSSRENGWLRLRVEDDGLGLKEEISFDTGNDADGGIGLRNTRTRLQRLYAENHEFSISRVSAAGGTEVSIKLPFKEGIETYDSEDSHIDS